MYLINRFIGSLKRKTGTAAKAAVVLGAMILTGAMVARVELGANENGSPTHAAATSAVAMQTTVVSAVPLGHAAATGLLPVVDQKDIIKRQRVIADAVLRALPSKCRNSLQSFYVTYDKNAANRGLGGESIIIVDGTVSDREFRALIIHECGHVVDLGGLRGLPSSGQSSFVDGNTPIFGDDPSVSFYQISWLTPTINQPGTKVSDFVSGYAASDPFEDFAETFAYFALQRKEFQRIAAKNPILKAKYDFMEKVVFVGEPLIALGKHVRGKSVPWDVTQLPYVWIAKA
jgi:hypothetical protein